MSRAELHSFLEEKYDQYNRSSFIETDPISIPHQFSKKEDIEISGFLAATIAWGQRVTIIRNANKLMKLMDNSPRDFVLNHSAKELKRLAPFVHRTFNGVDCVYFIQALKNIYLKHGGLEQVFSVTADVKHSISNFKKIFFELKHPARTMKHVSDPVAGSSAKRINMFLRWMVRKDRRDVDFGMWPAYAKPSADKSYSPTLLCRDKFRGEGFLPAMLCCPLDIHTGNVARKLGLLKRKQNDWLAVEELTNNLRSFDPIDPVKYDFALFGLGAFEGF
ncbi:MAG: DUF2400 domain-containing protein [Bacteroidetes bacterium]|nr:DUF2400 domain-containing protein [Bacteroidota bacterium]